MKYQTDTQLTHYINKYGCFYMCICYWIKWKTAKIEPSYSFLNSTWFDAIERGAISGDINKDGDMDDNGELLILNKDKLLSVAGIRLTYIGSFSPDHEISDGQYAIGEFYNNRTEFTHFVVIGKDKSRMYDPIFKSVTYREGKLKTIRIFA
jgi:hypothetical protein